MSTAVSTEANRRFTFDGAISGTGSLVKKTKVCRTVAEWRQISTKGNQNVRDLVESGQVCAGGPMCTGG